ncbi:sensor histidine kinase [Cupriavidus gilardii]|uniref:sensor histidine kinase n=1 Tax=Cupriavidus gilardii TaxID=82541 RepID=UPI0015718A86|nr:sensor histidine kinase [Cupriavidus gilardii]NSX05291.1 sensor histidine kinase [Cupriavidus gilardii]
MMSSTNRVFRSIGLLAIGVAAIPGFLEQWFAGPQAAAGAFGGAFGGAIGGGIGGAAGSVAIDPALAFAVALALRAIGVLAFASIFWRLTGRRGRPVRRGALMVVAQFAVGLVTDPDLLLIVAAELPFVLPLRAALAWLVVQCSAVVVMSGVAASQLEFSVRATVGPDRHPLDPSALPPAELVFAVGVLTDVAWLIFSFWMGYIAVSERRARLHLAASHAELSGTQHLLASSVRASERTRIARELHDAMGHHLTALTLHLDLAARLAGGKAGESVAVARDLARRLLGEVRAAVGAQRMPQPAGLREALTQLCAGLPGRRIELRMDDSAEPDDPVLAHVIFRCVQEAVSNAVRHGDAQQIRIDLCSRHGAVELRVGDNGIGAQAVQPGNGLRGMRERVEARGGTVHFHSRPGAGFHVHVSVPAGAIRTESP